ncbi:MAG: ACP S-malonyltransferase [Pseudomonadota bacterium]
MNIEADSKVALVFPGQGAQGADMLSAFEAAPSYGRLRAHLAQRLGCDPLRGEGDLNDNRVASLLTVTASLLALELWRQAHPNAVIAGLAGYSVGQWTALYAAGCFEEETLFEVISQRARFMDEACAAGPPGGMVSVIGVPLGDIKHCCARARAQGFDVFLANDNAPNQVTLAGQLGALSALKDIIAPLRPKQIRDIPVAGAWHSPAMAPAAARFERYLMGVTLRAPTLPIIDNVSGLAFKNKPAAHDLARQVAEPVLWQGCVRALISLGATQVIEMGHGNILTKFGFFIDRSVKHVAVSPPPRLRPTLAAAQ